MTPAPGADANGVFNVRDFGAKGDAAADDTDAIEAAIDAATGDADPVKIGRLAKGPVYLPPGIYKITRPLKVYSVSYLKFYGAGKSTRLYPVGTMPAVLDLNGVAFCQFEDFLIQGDDINETVEDVIAYYWDPAGAARSTGGCVFRNIQIQNVRFVSGLRAGKWLSNAQTDTTSYENLTIAGSWTPGETTYWQNGYMVGSGVFGNNLIHSFWNCSATLCGNGYHVSATNFMLAGGSLGQNGTDFKADTLSYFLVQGIRSERSERLMTVGAGPTNATANLSLSDILYEASGLDPSGSVIDWNGYNGTLAIRNLAINGTTKPANISAQPWQSLALILDGVTCGATLDGFLAKVSSKVDVNVRGFVTENTDWSGFSAASSGVVTNGSMRFLGQGQLRGQAGELQWTATRGRAETIACKDDIAPPRIRVERTVAIPRGQITVTVPHGLGGQPAIEDIGLVPSGTARVWFAGATATTLTFRTERAAPTAGIPFTYSASRQP